MEQQQPFHFMQPAQLLCQVARLRNLKQVITLPLVLGRSPLPYSTRQTAQTRSGIRTISRAAKK